MNPTDDIDTYDDWPEKTEDNPPHEPLVPYMGGKRLMLSKTMRDEIVSIRPELKLPTVPDLSQEQRTVYDALLSGIKCYPVQTLGGFAGTGKSTVISHLIRELGNWGVCAFTGKAANQLRKKGITEASTIHSLIYKPTKTVDKNGRIKVTFSRKEAWELPCRGFLVDESSMISTQIDRDLRSFGLPIIYVGDHGQLEPVGDNPGLMMRPMYRLETIHRNAGNIARFAEHLRRGGEATDFDPIPTDGNDAPGIVEFATMDSVPDTDLLSANQVICAYNGTRVALNQMVREHHGHTATVVNGERVMCLKNNRTLGLFNGMQGTVANLKYGMNVFDFEANDTVIPGVSYDPKQFGKERLDQDRNWGKNVDSDNPFDYAYCVTCHKFQGDEADFVIVIEQRCPKWSHQRWCYTSASRAKRRLIWITT